MDTANNRTHFKLYEMKTIRRKKCVICNESFKPFMTTTQRTCSIECAITFSKLKEAKSKQSLNEFKNEKVSEESLSKLIKSTEVLVHNYIRERDKGKPCVSCGKEWDSSFQAGHRFDKKQFHGIRFNLDNIHGQCQGCNIYNDGNYNEYHLRLPNRIGVQSYQNLEKRAEIAKRVPHTYTRHELKEIQKQVKQLKYETKR